MKSSTLTALRKNDLSLSLLSVAIGVLFCLGLALLIGENPINLLRALAQGSVGTVANLGYTLYYTTPLIFTGLSVAVAFHAGLFNIGAEGQLYVGAVAVAAVGLLLSNLSPVLAVPLGFIAALFAGGAWGSIIGILKVKRGSHEVIVSIMLNFIGVALAGFAIQNLFKNTASQNPETFVVGQGYFLPGLGTLSDIAPVNSVFVVALFVSLLVWWVLFKTKWGFEVRLAGGSAETAKRYGVPVGRRIVGAMALSGALAGLVAVNEIMGAQHKLKDQFSLGYGFVGIAVALVGRNNPFGIVGAALLFGAIQRGALGLEIETEHITRDFAQILQATIILMVAARSVFSLGRRSA